MLCIASPSYADLRGLPQITVLAASSLTEPLIEMARLYSEKEHITVTTSFDDSGELVREIDQGDSADVVITASSGLMSMLKQKGVLDSYSIRNIIKNRLALVRSKYIRGYQEKPTILEHLYQLDRRTIMVMADPETTTLGQYTKQVLEALSVPEEDLWKRLSRKVMRGASGKNTLYLILRGNTAGIVYASDAVNHDELQVIAIFDESLHTPIIYQGAVVVGENMSYARGFMEFLQSDHAHRIFLKYGFVLE